MIPSMYPLTSSYKTTYRIVIVRRIWALPIIGVGPGPHSPKSRARGGIPNFLVFIDL